MPCLAVVVGPIRDRMIQHDEKLVSGCTIRILFQISVVPEVV